MLVPEPRNPTHPMRQDGDITNLPHTAKPVPNMIVSTDLGLMRHSHDVSHELCIDF